MTCFFCKGTMTESTTTHVVDFGNCVIVIRNVPCLKCTQCGETSYTGDIVQNLENVIERVRELMSGVIVINYTDKVVA